jgi:hypothetical protein
MTKKCCKKNAVVLLFNKENEFDVLKFSEEFWEELVRVKPSCKNLVVKSIQLDFASPNLASTLNCGLAKIAKCYNIKNVISTMYTTSQELKVLEIICCKYRNKFKATGTGNALEAYVFKNKERIELINSKIYGGINTVGIWLQSELSEREKAVYNNELQGQVIQFDSTLYGETDDPTEFKAGTLVNFYDQSAFRTDDLLVVGDNFVWQSGQNELVYCSSGYEDDEYVALLNGQKIGAIKTSSDVFTVAGYSPAANAPVHYCERDPIIYQPAQVLGELSVQLF